MGAWGYNIKDNDTTADVIDIVTDLMSEGLSVEKASKAFLALPEWQDVLDDPDEMALIRHGLAYMAWTYGKVPSTLLKALKADYAANHGIHDWDDPAKRGKAVARFIEKLSVANPKPKSPPKPVQPLKRTRPPGFETGDCLAVKLKGGRYTAAYIVEAFQPEEGHGGNVVVEMNWIGKRKPTLTDFKTMKPLVLNHHDWKDQIALMVVPYRDKKLDSVVEVVGNQKLKFANIRVGRAHGAWVNWGAGPDWLTREMAKEDGRKIRADDPNGRYLMHGDWSLGLQVVFQEKWDAKKKGK
jgi:hypothetical protein